MKKSLHIYSGDEYDGTKQDCGSISILFILSMYTLSKSKAYRVQIIVSSL